MAIDLGNAPIGTPPTEGEKTQMRTALGLGSAATQNTGPSDGDVLQGDGSITVANAAQIMEIDGDGKARSSGKSFGATIEEVIKSVSTGKALTPADLFFSRGLGMTEWDFGSGLNTDTTTGTGSITVNEGKTCLISTGTTAGSTARRANGSSIKLLGHGLNMRVLSGSRPFFVLWRFGIGGSGITTNSQMRAFYGHQSADAVGPLQRKGFGFLVKNPATRRIYGIYHTGTGSEVEVDLGVNQSSESAQFCAAYLDGAGNIQWFVGGSHVGSASGLGTANFAQDSRFGYEILNGVDASNASVYAGSITIGQTLS